MVYFDLQPSTNVSTVLEAQLRSGSSSEPPFSLAFDLWFHGEAEETGGTNKDGGHFVRPPPVIIIRKAREEGNRMASSPPQ